MKKNVAFLKKVFSPEKCIGEKKINYETIYDESDVLCLRFFLRFGFFWRSSFFDCWNFFKTCKKDAFNLSDFAEVKLASNEAASLSLDCTVGIFVSTLSQSLRVEIPEFSELIFSRVLSDESTRAVEVGENWETLSIDIKVFSEVVGFSVSTARSFFVSVTFWSFSKLCNDREGFGDFLPDPFETGCIFISDPVPAKMAAVSVFLFFGSCSWNPSVKSSCMSFALKKRRWRGSFKMRFDTKCLKICLKKDFVNVAFAIVKSSHNEPVQIHFNATIASWNVWWTTVK